MVITHKNVKYVLWFNQHGSKICSNTIYYDTTIEQYYWYYDCLVNTMVKTIVLLLYGKNAAHKVLHK